MTYAERAETVGRMDGDKTSGTWEFSAFHFHGGELQNLQNRQDPFDIREAQCPIGENNWA